MPRQLAFTVRKRAGQHRAGGDYFPADAPDDPQTWYADSIFGQYKAYETFAKPHRRFAVCPGARILNGKIEISGVPHKIKAESLDHAKKLCNDHYRKLALELIAAI